MDKYTEEKNRDGQPLVTVQCMAYNHEAFIRQCLDSIVTQETDFSFEVLVHDDASTDSTPDIIREYEARYPGVVIGIFQKENQFSRGGFAAVNAALMARSRGAYAAFCECDDYWTDSHKLQKQFDSLKKNNAVLCTHKVGCVDINGASILNKQIPHIDEAFAEDPDKMIPRMFEYWISDSDIFHASSIFCRVDALLKDDPEFVHICKVGDAGFFLKAIANGRTVYLPELMSCYRQHGGGSWTESITKSRERLMAYGRNMCDTLESYKEYTKHRYDSCIDDKIHDYQFNMLMQEGRYREVFDKKYRKTLNRKSMKHRVKLLLYCVMPSIMKAYDRKHGRLVYGWEGNPAANK